MTVYSFFKRRKVLKTENSLNLIPIRLIDHEISANKKIKLIVPRFTNRLLEKVFTGKKIQQTFAISLDDTGSKTWLAIDGTKSIGQISKEISDGKENFEEPLIQFISKLYNEGFITFKQLLSSKG